MIPCAIVTSLTVNYLKRYQKCELYAQQMHKDTNNMISRTMVGALVLKPTKNKQGGALLLVPELRKIPVQASQDQITNASRHYPTSPFPHTSLLVGIGILRLLQKYHSGRRGQKGLNIHLQ